MNAIKKHPVTWDAFFMTVNSKLFSSHLKYVFNEISLTRVKSGCNFIKKSGIKNLKINAMDPEEKNSEMNKNTQENMENDPKKNESETKEEKNESKHKVTIEKGKRPIDFDDLFF